MKRVSHVNAEVVCDVNEANAWHVNKCVAVFCCSVLQCEARSSTIATR